MKKLNVKLVIMPKTIHMEYFHTFRHGILWNQPYTIFRKRKLVTQQIKIST